MFLHIDSKRQMFHSEMRFLFIVVYFLKSCTSIPSPKGKYTSNKLFESDLDYIQGAMLDIGAAGEDLKTMERKLAELVGKKDTIYQVEDLLQGAVDKTVYLNSWNENGSGKNRTRTSFYKFS